MERVKSKGNGSEGIMSVSGFTSDFMQEYLEAFTEMKRLGSDAGTRHSQGKNTVDDDVRIGRLHWVLKALSNKSNLTAKQIEALEYLLKSYNKSLATPGIPDIVDYSILPHYYSVILGPGIFSIAGQGLLFDRSLLMEKASFTFSGEDINFANTSGYIMNANYGYFQVVGVTTGLTVVEARIDVSSDLTSISPTSQIRSTFNSGIPHGSAVLTLQGLSDSGSSTIRFASSVTVTVEKLTNGGLAEDAGTIEYRKNGITVSTTSFILGDTIDDMYVFTGLVATDDISTVINEG